MRPKNCRPTTSPGVSSLRDRRSNRAIVAVDTGGTFTDLVMCHDGGTAFAKVLSTPSNPAAAILAGLEVLRRDLTTEAPVGRLIHGTTVATNAVLERRGAATVFVTNRGFRDLLTIGRQNRPSLYDLEVRRPRPLVGRERCLEIGGRLDKSGVELEPITPPDLDDLVRAITEADSCESIAICLLHSYANPAHEVAVAEELRAAFPGIPISLSSEVLPLFREYERAVTTTLNAYVRPVMSRYLSELSRRLATKLLIMQSDGGTVSADQAGKLPVRTLLSGPAGGVVGAARAGHAAGLKRVISFDMGGTSTDVSLVDGQPTLTSESSIGGLPVAVSTLDIHTVGAGGGSIAWRDRGGALKVGPQSAGADPGPACYGRGDQATVTDAHVVLGRLPDTVTLGGTLSLSRNRAELAVGRLAESIGLDVPTTARGIIDVANARMIRAIKVISLERGYDPRDFALVSFGGAGGLHACELADALNMSTVIVPRAPGLLSAVGMLNADLTQVTSKTVLQSYEPGEDIDAEHLRPILVPLDNRATCFFEQHGVPPSEQTLRYRFELRYLGQSHELPLELKPPFVGLIEAFHERHERRYGYRLPARPVEWVSVHVHAVGAGHPGALGDESGTTDALASTEFGKVVARSCLSARSPVVGPAIVVEYSASTLVPAGWSLKVHTSGALLLTRSSL